MRRAQSVRHYSRPSLALASDDLGVLREPGESDEDVLRKQLIEKDRLVDQVGPLCCGLCIGIGLFVVSILFVSFNGDRQSSAFGRVLNEQMNPCNSNSNNALQRRRSTNSRRSIRIWICSCRAPRGRTRAMSDLEKVKAHEKLLESKLRELAGENWQSSLDIPPPVNLGVRGMGMLGHQRSATLGSGSPFAGNSSFAGNSPFAGSNSSFTGNSSFAGGLSFPSDTSFDSMSTPTPHTPPPRGPRSSSRPSSQSQSQEQQQQQQRRQEALAAKLEQVKLLLLGMDQRLKVREGVLAKSVERAESSLRTVEKVTREGGKDACVMWEVVFVVVGSRGRIRKGRGYKNFLDSGIPFRSS